ncbi:MAG: hypothetical protein HY321_03810 [Armatimonadetes bacterium]|nr:hypothetical protein [Armatimonadota bacterium]
METQKDFAELLTLLSANGVEYAIVGGYALAFHGAPRYTGDLDIYVRPTEENARRVMAALREFGFGSVGLSESDFSEPDQVVQLGFPPVRVDLITSLSGVSWEEVSAHKVAGQYGEIPVPYIGREEFLANKRACGRRKDLADIEALGEE